MNRARWARSEPGFEIGAHSASSQGAPTERYRSLRGGVFYFFCFVRMLATNDAHRSCEALDTLD